jgi:hypothetical protein
MNEPRKFALVTQGSQSLALGLALTAASQLFDFSARVIPRLSARTSRPKPHVAIQQKSREGPDRLRESDGIARPYVPRWLCLV